MSKTPIVDPVALKWVSLLCVAYGLHTVAAVVESVKVGGNPFATALEWPLYRVRTQPVPNPELDVPFSLLGAIVEVAFTAWMLVAINDWFDARYTGLTFQALVAGAFAVVAVPLLVLSWLASGVFQLVFRVLLKVLTS